MESLDLNTFDAVSAPAAECFVLLVDAQERLMPAIDRGAEVARALDRLARAADLLEVPLRATEHCAEAIGATVPGLLARVGRQRILAKRHFDAMVEPGVPQAVAALDRGVAVVAGVEAHVCVAQTVLGLGRAGYRVRVVTDACGSRRTEDRAAGLARMRMAGAVPVTVEALIFEWLGSADHPAFRTALGIVKEG